MQNAYSHHHIYSLCQQNMNQYVLVQTIEGHKIDGIISGVDQHYIYLDIPIRDGQIQADMRYGPGFGFGFPGFYGYPGFGFGYPFWGWRRLVLPLTALVALSALGPLFW